MDQQKTFPELYSTVINEWPETIDISDVDREIKTNFGYLFPRISMAWNRIDGILSEDSQLESMMNWSMFGIFQIKAMALIEDEIYILRPKDIPEVEVEQNFWEYLQVEGWAALKPFYKRDEKLVG